VRIAERIEAEQRKGHQDGEDDQATLQGGLDRRLLLGDRLVRPRWRCLLHAHDSLPLSLRYRKFRVGHLDAPLQLPVYVEKETRRLVRPGAHRSRMRRHTLRPVSRSNGHRSPLASLDRICELAEALAPILEDATDAGVRRSG